jgi:hypothetical protein
MNDDELLPLCPDGRRLIGVLVESCPEVELFVAYALATGVPPHFLFANTHQWKDFENHRNCCVVCSDSDGQAHRRMPT